MADPDSRAGVRYVEAKLVEFLDSLHAAHDGPLAAAFEAPASEGMPAIQVSASEGRLLTLLLALHGSRKVVELGTLAGYSAIRMARALPDGGRLWTVELEESHARVARSNIERAGLSTVVEVVVGEGLAVLADLAGEAPFDVVFLDADKSNYEGYGRWAAAHLRSGGLLLADNAYLFGKLMEDTDTAASMRRFHEQAARDFETVCIPTPDGLLLGIKP